MNESISNVKSNYENLVNEELDLRKYELSELKKVKVKNKKDN